MCGFIGVVKNNKAVTTDILQMRDIITHRGPDDGSVYEDDYVQFGFRRLSIIDLENGRQPLSYENERYWIIFNGEIYNYLELREALINKGHSFKTASDTEVIVALYSDKGVDAVKDLRGMFGFVIWDKLNQEVFAARDHFGIKPFYYFENEDALFCASEMKSILLELEGMSVDENSLQHYLTYQFTPEPKTMVNHINKLEPGHYLMKKIGEKTTIAPYWRPSFSPVQSDLSEAVKQIQATLRDSVKVHMRSDVPVGSFLSGGIDSSAIVALAKEINPHIKTFTVGFEREGYSEQDVARETAEKLNVENISYTISPEEFIKEFPKIMWNMDEPVADPAAIPLYFVAREARKQVKVVLSGEGADELFGGYNIYREPSSLRGFSYVPSKAKDVLKLLAQQIPEGIKGKSFVERGCTSIEDRYIGNAKMFTEFEKRLLLKHYNDDISYTQITKPLYDDIKNYDDVTKMQYIDMHTWLRGDILVKADRMTMANSLELRVPFLDKEVFQVASSLNSSLKIADGTTKFALREAMKRIVPDHVLHRRKLGFPVPIRVWLKDELYDWAKTLITTSQTDHLFNKHYLLTLLEDHRVGKLDCSRKLWTVLTFMIWHQIYVENVYSFSTAEKSILHT